MRLILKEMVEAGGRQAAVFDRLVQGQSEKQIAANLGVSAHTVHAHIKAIYRRLQRQQPPATHVDCDATPQTPDRIPSRFCS